jgi:hypothetical protein
LQVRPGNRQPFLGGTVVLDDEQRIVEQYADATLRPDTYGKRKLRQRQVIRRRSAR